MGLRVQSWLALLKRQLLSWLPLFPVFHVIVSALWLSTVSFRINPYRSPQPSLGLWQSFSFFGLFVCLLLLFCPRLPLCLVNELLAF